MKSYQLTTMVEEEGLISESQQRFMDEVNLERMLLNRVVIALFPLLARLIALPSFPDHTLTFYWLILTNGLIAFLQIQLGLKVVLLGIHSPFT